MEEGSRPQVADYFPPQWHRIPRVGPDVPSSERHHKLSEVEAGEQLEALFEQEIAEGQQFYVVYGDSAYAYG